MKDRSLSLTVLIVLAVLGLVIGLVAGLVLGLHSQLMCEVITPSILMDAPGHLPPLEQQIPIGLGAHLHLVQVRDGYVLVRFTSDVEGYLPLSACRLVY